MVASSQPGGSDPDRTTPSVLMISVDCVQPIGLAASDCRQMAHRGRAVRIDLEPGRDLVGDAELLQHFRDVNPGRRRLGVRNEDRIRREQRRAQARGIVDRDLRIAGADRERGLDQADIRDRGGNDELLFRQLGDQSPPSG